jgi:anti-sigma factor RsiW
MDADELLDYALGRLDGPRRELLERRLANDPALAERVRRLIRNLGRLLDDGRADRRDTGSTAHGPPDSTRGEPAEGQPHRHECGRYGRRGWQ